MESLHKAGVLLALDGLHTGTGPPFRRHGSDDEYREVGLEAVISLLSLILDVRRATTNRHERETRLSFSPKCAEKSCAVLGVHPNSRGRTCPTVQLTRQNPPDAMRMTKASVWADHSVKERDK